MDVMRLLLIITWISIPTVMYGGYALLGFHSRNKLSGFQRTYFRAGHAHAGVLLLMALLYQAYIRQTALAPALQIGAVALLLVGVLAQSGGFFLHLLTGKAGEPSRGTQLTSLGALLLAAAVLVLVYGLIFAPAS